MIEPIRIRIDAEYQRLADTRAVPTDVRKVLSRPLQHQIDTVTAIANSDILINAYPTGTGKTQAALLWLLEHPRASTLLIAPVNELVRQHAQDAKQFVDNAGLPHAVAAVDAAYLRQPSLNHLPHRPGERFYRILTNPLFLPEMQSHQGNEKPPLLLVTNPDLFYYGVFYLFNHLDRRNIAEQFINKFQYVVIDEVHYYNAKQFTNLLFFVLLSKSFGYFEPHFPEQRKICLLTATPDSDLNLFIERVGDEGIAVRRLDPEPVRADDPFAAKCLTDVELELYPYTRDAAGEFRSHVDRFAALVTQGKDGAILLNSLYGVNRLAKSFEQKIGVQKVGRITGPLSHEERKQAPFRPLLLATPTVDIGFNFEGYPKDRQNLDFVGFEAQFEDQFWQRLGRDGRVLGKRVQDVNSFALALIPDGPWTRLRAKLDKQATLSRAELKHILSEVAEGDMQRPSFAEYVKSYSLLEVTQPLVEMEKLLGAENSALIEQAFEMIKRVYAPSSKRHLWSLRGEIRRCQDFRRLRGELRKTDVKPNAAVVTALREYAKEEKGRALPEEEAKRVIEQVLCNPGGRDELREYVAREVAALQPVFSFRAGSVGVEIEADDPLGLISPARETVWLDLFHLLRFYQWQIKEEGQSERTGLCVVLQDILEPPLNVGWTFRFDGSWEEFRRCYTRKPTALRGLTVSRHKQGSIVTTPAQMIGAVSQEHVPCLVLEETDLKPWQWASLIRDGIYPTDLKVIFRGSMEKHLRLLGGLDGYRVMGRYGWSIQRETGEWWVV